jgi:hypothetical protein
VFTFGTGSELSTEWAYAGILWNTKHIQYLEAGSRTYDLSRVPNGSMSSERIRDCKNASDWSVSCNYWICNARYATAVRSPICFLRSESLGERIAVARAVKLGYCCRTYSLSFVSIAQILSYLVIRTSQKVEFFTSLIP